MPDHEAKLASLEGRLLAHRALVARLIGLLSPDQQQDMRDWIAARNVMADGQEDPGAVPDIGATIELALADEMRRVQERILHRG